MTNLHKNITQLGENKYRVRVSAGRNPRTGKRDQPGRTVHGTINDAIEVRDELTKAHQPAVRGAPHTFGDLYHLWDQATLARGSRRPLTAYIDTGLFRNYIEPVFADVPLATIRQSHLNAFYDDLSRTLAPASVYKIHAKIGAVLQFGVRRDYVYRNVAALAEPPRVPRHDPYAPEADEVFELLDHMLLHDRQLWLLYRISATIGLRRNEICAITFGDIDLERATIDVCRSVDAVPGQELTFSGTKTGDIGHGKLSIDNEIVDVLAERRREVAHEAIECGISIDEVMLFPGKDLTTPCRPDSLSKKVLRYLRRYEHLPHVTIKDLRAFVATELESDGFSLMTAKAVLRHASDATTAKYYVASRDRKAREATASIGTKLQRRHRYTKNSRTEVANDHSSNIVQFSHQ